MASPALSLRSVRLGGILLVAFLIAASMPASATDPACVSGAAKVCAGRAQGGDISCEEEESYGYDGAYVTYFTFTAAGGVFIVPFSCTWYEGKRWDVWDLAVVMWTGNGEECYAATPVWWGEVPVCPLRSDTVPLSLVP